MRRSVLTVVIACVACGPTGVDVDAGSIGGGSTGGGSIGGGSIGGGSIGGGSIGGGSIGGGSIGGGSSGGSACIGIGPWTPRLAITLRDGGAPPQPLDTRVPLDVRISGLPPCLGVGLEFRLDGGFVSSASFVSDPTGGVVTSRDSPTAGAWTSVAPEAFLATLSNQGASSPAVHHLDVRLTWDGGPALGATVQRTPLPPGTVVTQFREATPSGLHGDFFRPPGTGPFPGVVVFGGSEGGLGGGQLTASALVADGFAVLAIAYFGVPGKPGGMSRIPLETFERAAQRLRAFPEVDGRKIGVLGVSRGGEAALLAGASFTSSFQAVVALVPSGSAWAAPNSATVSTWTLDGGDVPFLPWPTGSNTFITRDAGYSVSFSAPFFNRGLDTAIDAGLSSRAEIAVERIAGPVLLLAAQDDGIWPSCRLARIAWGRLVDAGHVTRGDDFVCFPNAGHSINPSRAGFPLFDLIDRGTGNARTGYGGDVFADDAANRQLAQRVSAFFRLALQ